MRGQLIIKEKLGPNGAEPRVLKTAQESFKIFLPLPWAAASKKGKLTRGGESMRDYNIKQFDNKGRLSSSDRLGFILSRLEGVRKVGNGWVALCPAHDDHNPSLSIGFGSDG